MIFYFLLNFLIGKEQSNAVNTPRVIHLPSLFKAHGVIFNKDYIPNIHIVDMGWYTPELDDIELAESILQAKYNELRKTNVNVTKYFCKYIRQYIGILDHSGNKNIIVQLINTGKKRPFRKSVGDSYKEHFIIQFDDNVQSQIFKINLEKHSLSTQL